jgi:hypothetical protein
MPRIGRETHDLLERETLLRVAGQWDKLADYKSRKESEET